MGIITLFPSVMFFSVGLVLFESELPEQLICLYFILNRLAIPKPKYVFALPVQVQNGEGEMWVSENVDSSGLVKIPTVLPSKQGYFSGFCAFCPFCHKSLSIPGIPL